MTTGITIGGVEVPKTEPMFIPKVNINYIYLNICIFHVGLFKNILSHNIKRENGEEN